MRWECKICDSTARGRGHHPPTPPPLKPPNPNPLNRQQTQQLNPPTLQTPTTNNQHQALRFLQPHDILRLGCCSRRLRRLADSDLVWRIKWTQRFSALWAHPLVQSVLARRLSTPTTQPPPAFLPAARVLRTLPRGGWKAFYSTFELEWPAWLCAGYNTEQRCLVGLYGSVYDLTDFLEAHPGSKETVLINAGGDATAFYEDVGHSAQARALMQGFLCLAPPPVEGDSRRGIPARCVLERVRDAVAAARRRVEGVGDGGAVGGVGGSKRAGLRSLSGGVSMGAFTTFPEEAAAVLLGGPLAAGLLDVEEEEEEEGDDMDGSGSSGSSGSSGAPAFSSSSSPPAAAAAALPPPLYDLLQLAWAAVGEAAAAQQQQAQQEEQEQEEQHEHDDDNNNGTGGGGGCGGWRGPAQHFLPFPPADPSPCPESSHLGQKRAVLDLVTGEWLSWRSCCGRLRCERRAARGRGLRRVDGTVASAAVVEGAE